MFGHHDDKKDDDTSSEAENVITPDQPADKTTDATATEDTSSAGQAAAIDDTPAPAAAESTDAPADTPGTAPVTDTTSNDTKPADNTVSDDTAWQHPGTPLEDTAKAEATVNAPEEETPEEEEPEKSPEPIKDIVGSSAGPDFKPFPALGSDEQEHEADNTPHELIDIKQKALNDLTPLVDQLEQSPEDKFRTVMMMIQASDDQTLVQAAYTAAHEIKDEKTRAQALLDIVNEINYFTQHPEN